MLLPWLWVSWRRLMAKGATTVEINARKDGRGQVSEKELFYRNVMVDDHEGESAMADPTNFRRERIEKLLHELRYEVERGMLEREILMKKWAFASTFRSATKSLMGSFSASSGPGRSLGMLCILTTSSPG